MRPFGSPDFRFKLDSLRPVSARARLAALLLGGAALLGFGATPAPAQNPDGWFGRTEISDVPWDSAPLKKEAAAASSAVQPKVIYGADNRIDVYQESDSLRRQLAASTCALVSSGQLASNGAGGFNLQTSAYRQSGLPACSGEAFANQPVAAFCTGFLVAPDIIVTAGHCYDSGDIGGVRFVFGFVMRDSSSAATSFAANQVYQGIQVISQRLDSSTLLDYSVIRLDRAVTAPGATVLPIRRTGTIPAGTQIGVIGHPSGLPEKIAFGSDTQVYDTSNSVYFTANLDTYGGNSGSPVFDAATGVVEGILVRGETDFLTTSNCFYSNTLSNSAAGEQVTKAPNWAAFVPQGNSQTGTVSIAGPTFVCGGPLTVAVADGGLIGSGSVNVALATSGGDQQTVALTEAPANSGSFSASVPTAIGSPVANNGTIEVQHDQTVTATYNDADTGSGSPGVATDSALADCVRDDYLTELFESGMDLDNTTLVFTPNGSADGYSVCRASASAYPTDPAGGADLSAVGDDGTLQVSLTNGAVFPYFGQSKTSFFVNANGFITFGAGASDYSPSTAEHFARVQISAAWQDLNPTAGGLVSTKQTSDRVAVTWDGVPQWNTTNSNQVQVELFFNGVIAITHLRVDMGSGLVGLSRGAGQQADFLNSNLSAYPACNQTNGSAIVSESIPELLLPNQTVHGAVNILNNGNTTWTTAGGYGLLAAVDTCGLAQPSQINLPSNVSVPPGGSYSFPITLRTTAATGYCGIYWVMTQGANNFGEGLTTHINVGSEFNFDFGAAAAGWYGGVVSGGGSVFLEPNGGMCLSTPASGDNISGWVSPDAYIPLVDMSVAQIQITASTDQTTANQIPAWDLSYDNIYSTGQGPAYGGELIVLDTAGGANGVGRPQGRTSFEIWAAPNAALAPQWRGTLNTGAPGENNNSAFTPAADPLNDTRLVYRTIDIASDSYGAGVDSGKLCVKSLRATRRLIPALQTLSTPYTGGITNATHEAQTLAQAQENAGSAQIFDNGQSATFQLTASGPGSRKTLFPFIDSLFDAGNPAAYAPLYPISWASDTIYLGTIFVASFVNGGLAPEGTDPPDTVMVNLDAATSELVNIHFTTRGGPGYFAAAASPRLVSTAGGVQPYIGFFHGHHVTAVDLNVLPNANRLRIQADFYNTAAIAPQGFGANPFLVSGMRVDVVAP